MTARRPFSSLTLIAAVLVLANLALPARAQSRQADADPSYREWARVLQSFVDERGKVDFRRLAGDRLDLDAFLDYVARVSPRTAPELFSGRDAVLAYYVNAYNALAMFNVIDSGFPRSLDGLYKVWFFAVKRFSIGGERMSLYALENNVIRPLGDERVHFALNCMTVSCPRLPREPYLAQRLNHQLEDGARQFFAESRNLQMVPVRKLMRVSSILKFYTTDFLAKSPTLSAYIEKYTDKRIPGDFRIEFLDYDWTVNYSRSNAAEVQWKAVKLTYSVRAESIEN